MDEFTRGAIVALAAAAIFAPLWWEARRQARWRRHMSTVPGMVDRRAHPSRLPALCLRCQATVPDLPTHVRLAHLPRVVGVEDRSDWRTR